MNLTRSIKNITLAKFLFIGILIVIQYGCATVSEYDDWYSNITKSELQEDELAFIIGNNHDEVFSPWNIKTVNYLAEIVKIDNNYLQGGRYAT